MSSIWGTRAIDSMRKSGYKNTAYAIGELVDNSIQAGADNVKMVVHEEDVGQGRKRIMEIAIVDNGEGMDESTLSDCLKFGEGTRADNKTGMGKFGIGLPQASISQCTDISVYSWQKGLGSSNFVRIDISDKNWVKSGAIAPTAEKKLVPDSYKQYLNNKSGTLIIWKNLDRLKWKSGKYLFQNSEELLGRMYRYWLDEKSENKVDIEYIRVDKHNKSKPDDPIQVLPTDPLYLTKKTSVSRHNPPEEPMFQTVPQTKPFVMNYNLPNGQIGEVTITVSYATKLTRFGKCGTLFGGRKAWGYHCARNSGLSIVREERELDLDNRWLKSANHAWERWIGAELKFGRNMDEVFDVSNNKQSANRLSEVCGKTWKDFAELDNEKDDEIQERLQRRA